MLKYIFKKNNFLITKDRVTKKLDFTIYNFINLY